jgi:hypothetical protein
MGTERVKFIVELIQEYLFIKIRNFYVLNLSLVFIMNGKK